MATFRLRRFSNPEILRAIAPTRLLAFLEPHRDCFADCRLILPRAPTAGTIDYEGLVNLFMSPEAGLPKDLLDALFLVDEMATPWGMDALLQAAREARLPLEESADDTPADVAVEVWLRDPNLLEREHAGQSLSRPRCFECYQTHRQPVPPFVLPTANAQRCLEHDLDEWSAQSKRGRGTRVFVYPREDEVWFLVRHGEPFKREESLQGKETASVCYRPLKYDVLIYLPQAGELRVNARSRAQKQQYRRLFGRHFFGDDELFPGDSKYTLAPLREQREAALVCVDVQGVERITLKEVQFRWDEPVRAVEIHKANDLFLSLRFRNSQALAEAQLDRAVFQVKFADAKRPRSVTICAGNVAHYTRDADAERLEQWLRLRGFIVVPPRPKEVPDATVARA